ncbi:hypothetical protein D3C77_724940 [compost metagenome]
MHRLVFAAVGVNEARNEFYKTFAGIMTFFFFYYSQTKPLGAFEAVDDGLAPFIGMAIGMPGGDQIINIVSYVGAKARAH